ncbi:YraN family protein [Candidatus Cyanaurora vandensis]|uniref:YraN family protein n=1 Tax=Candidatus Cyanaurora vandensis TaxID=2714958 RepID=UPI0025807A54|nr:YraN family protein [Candidatus Cyanaurora vandensis]
MDDPTGVQAEQWLATQLVQAGWQVLAQRWRCPWGELDLVVMGNNLVAFVEVKARRRLGPDAGGALAVGRGKQRRLIRAAGLFLADHPELAEASCRFDVALIVLGAGGFQLREYLSGAFEVE